ncbi:alpha/beta hydrolase [uncultured Algimonas sp.]|uniref:alpha/beta hydrolase family protein n=1 Tax=uncultured Algimonas sp. TaxID=1547920 RepID=UPI00262630CA|nr:alpha/beta hydrolase [uncultured Algimonas sp.]
MKTERFEFPGALGHNLAGRLDLPEDGKVIDYVVFAHGFTIGKNFKPLQTIAKALVDEGYGMLRFDFTGLGGSGGDFSDTNFSTNVQEIEAAAAYLAENYEAPGILVGHSFGGTAALKAAENLPSVTAIATIGSPCSTTHIVHNFGDKLEEIIESGQAEVMLAGRPFIIKDQFLDDIKKHDIAEGVGDLDRALLIFHSPQDRVVLIDNASHLFRFAKHPKSFVSLDGADHLLLKDECDADYVGRVLAAWAPRYDRGSPDRTPTKAR